MIELSKTEKKEAYRQLELAEEGDTIDYTPHELITILEERLPYKRNVISLSSVKNTVGLKTVILWNKKSDTYNFTIGTYGYNDMPTDRGFKIEQKGYDLNATYSKNINTNVFDEFGMSEKDKNKLEEQLLKGLKDSESIIPELIIDSWMCDYYLSRKTIACDVENFSDYYAGHIETRDLISEYSNKYQVDLDRYIRRAVINDDEYELRYDISID